MDLPLCSGRVAPAWDVARRSFPRLDADVRCDVAIIGGGIAGLTSALSLTERGYKVVVLEAARFAEGSTGWCAGILSASTTVDLNVVGRALGADAAQRVLHTVTDALDRYGKLFPSAFWQTGSSVYLAARPRHFAQFSEEMTAHQRYGMPAALVQPEQLLPTWRGFHGGIEMSNEHAVNPVALSTAIVEKLHQHGVRLFEQSPVTHWQSEGGSVKVHTPAGTVHARHLVNATGLSGMDKGVRKRIDRYLIPVTGHIVVTKPSADVLRLVSDRGIIAAWDTLSLYHYVRYMADGRLLIGGGEEARIVPFSPINSSNRQVSRLIDWTRRHHGFEIPEVEHAWRATLVVPADGMPFIQSQSRSGSRVVNVVTDGLPSAMAMGDAIAELVDTGMNWLADRLSTRRRMPLHARMSALVPRNRLLRSLVHAATFKAIELYDRM